ncbi:forespore capture DNA-binding protein RefZ [Lentibacillus saliphilus]|uniref:forespore capture DNA-binding protein RefZ n=1 Tax=Lentibacillus saliphilus TaxID=2737028 RepID=UPI001C30152C|nr:forespore capture DNA-binding protein RefZ [Lentibacillus saliphilus]
MKRNSSKLKVIEAASVLFYQKGFNGTSVRDIADYADVNVSLISYYFQNKQGLLEYAVTNYYESYLQAIEALHQDEKLDHPVDQLKQIVSTIIQYKQTHQQLSCLIHRELSLDSVFVREVTVTYLAKENYYIREAFFNVLPERLKTNYQRQFLYLQFKGMLAAPYVLHNEWKNQSMDQYSDQRFAEQYARTIHAWIDHLTDEAI